MEGAPIWHFYIPAAFYTRLTKPKTKLLHVRGIVFESFIDDCIKVHAERNVLVRLLTIVQKFLHQFDWLVNPEKSETKCPRQL